MLELYLHVIPCYYTCIIQLQLGTQPQPASTGCDSTCQRKTKQSATLTHQRSTFMSCNRTAECAHHDHVRNGTNLPPICRHVSVHVAHLSNGCPMASTRCGAPVYADTCRQYPPSFLPPTNILVHLFISRVSISSISLLSAGIATRPRTASKSVPS